jgi:GNAT superfamily N-acetyltransferase
VVADPALLPALLEKLLGPHPEKWSAAEHSRAASLRALAESVDGKPAGPDPAPVEYDETTNGVVARIGAHVVGVAAFALTRGRELTIEVAPAWRRLGIGTNLLTRAASQAAADGVDEILLLAPAEDEGFVAMVSGAGLRARIKVSDGMLQARIVVTGVRRSPGSSGRLPAEPREDLAETPR